MSKAYPSNLTWQQWELIAGEFPPAKSGGRPRNVAIYAVVNWLEPTWCRRLSKDYERLPQTSKTFIYVAMIRIMIRRLA
jgi:transposase